MKAILGKKIGMTSIFDAAGKNIACTVIEAGPCVVTQVKTMDTDGYNALQLGFGNKKEKSTSAGAKGHFSKANTAPKTYLYEVRNPDMQKTLGEVVDSTIFEEGEKINIISKTKGRGFQGVVKRHGFSGVGQATHGQHDRSRAPGSLGNSSDASRVMKGMRMAGRMGSNRVKTKNLKVVKIFPEQNLMVISGAIPGSKGTFVVIEKN
jgi:large subunit ribosomal protein L3